MSKTFVERVEKKDYAAHEIWHDVAMGNLEEVKTGLSSFPINTKDCNGRTVLSFAATNGRLLIVDFLLQQPSIDVNITNNSGQTVMQEVDSKIAWLEKSGKPAGDLKRIKELIVGHIEKPIDAPLTSSLQRIKSHQRSAPTFTGSLG